ncbi:MAG: hypothetical protein H7240_08305 [Glaciimonas sp.]|nr:hypothetical protein [Glaciimonas sp.]
MQKASAICEIALNQILLVRHLVKAATNPMHISHSSDNAAVLFKAHWTDCFETHASLKKSLEDFDKIPSYVLDPEIDPMKEVF